MSGVATTAAAVPFETESKEIAAAITTLGLLLPTGMSITVVHPAGRPAVVEVTYPDGTVCAKEFKGGAVH